MFSQQFVRRGRSQTVGAILTEAARQADLHNIRQKTVASRLMIWGWTSVKIVKNFGQICGELHRFDKRGVE
jgi:hypothetical protein